MELLFNVLSILISVVAVVIAAASYRHSRAKAKTEICALITAKEAELSAINSTFFSQITSYQYRPGREQAEVKKMVLEKELAYLKERV